jgi:hypothetical protein
MDGMRDLGSFGDERLKKGAPISSRRCSISGHRASDGSAAHEAGKCDLAASCITLRSRQRK